MKNHYEILGIDKYASPDDIKAAHRLMIKKYHPDLNPGNPFAEEMTKLIVEAYGILSDPVKKEKYDKEFHLNSIGNWIHHLITQKFLSPFQFSNGICHRLNGPIEFSINEQMIKTLRGKYRTGFEKGGIFLFKPARTGGMLKMELTQIVFLKNISGDPRNEYQFEMTDYKNAVKSALSNQLLPCIFHSHPTKSDNYILELHEYHKQMETSILDRIASQSELFPGTFNLRLPEFLVIGNGRLKSGLFVGVYGGLVAPLEFGNRKKELQQKFSDKVLGGIENWLETPAGKKWGPAVGIGGVILMCMYPKSTLNLFASTAVALPPILYQTSDDHQYFGVSDGRDLTIKLPLITDAQVNWDEMSINLYRNRRKR